MHDNLERIKLKSVKEITSTARQLERFLEEGLRLDELIGYHTDYRYLVVNPNYVFYRIEGDTVRVTRILNERQDFINQQVVAIAAACFA